MSNPVQFPVGDQSVRLVERVGNETFFVPAVITRGYSPIHLATLEDVWGPHR